MVSAQGDRYDAPQGSPWNASRLVRVLVAWGKTWTTWPGLFWGGLAVAGGYSLGYAIWSLLNRPLVDRMIAHGMERPSNLFSLAWCVGLGILLTLAWWVGVAYWRAGRGDRPEADSLQGARWMSGLNLLIPLMCLYWQWRNRWWHNPIAAVIVAAILGLGIALLVSRVRISARWMSWIGDRLSFPLVIVLGLLFLVGIGWVGVMRHRSFNSGALDLAMMDQLVWNTSRGRMLQGAFTGRYPGSFLGHHFSPILVMLAPLYWFWPSPETLIVVQAAAVALSALSLYFTGVRLTGQRWLAACLSASLLFHPALHEGMLFDFHQDALGMLFLSLGLMCVAHERWAWAGIGWLLSLSCKEEIAVYWVAIAAYLLLQNPGRRWVFAAFALLNVAWLVAVLYLVIPAFHAEPGGSFAFFGRYGDFGATPVEWAVTLITNPIYVLRVMLTSTRVGGVAVLTLSMSFLLWKGGPKVLVLLSPLAINLLSNLNLQHGFAIHYSMLPLVIVYTAALYGAKKWLAGARPLEGPVPLSVERWALFVLVTFLVLFVWLSPLGLRITRTLRDFQVDTHDEIGRQIVRALPPTAYVVAQNTLLPHLSQREYMTLFPLRPEREPDYYVFDVTGHLYPLSPEQYHKIVAQTVEDPDYGPICVEDGYIVLRRGGGRDRVAEALTILDQMGPLASK